MERMLRSELARAIPRRRKTARVRRAAGRIDEVAPKLLLPVPGEPETSTLLPRKTPLPPSISSSPAMPVDTRSADAL